ncbi:sugar kinase [Nonomuraea sp. K274]|uniref:Sugar kinase n=1 Tax=Nonomuraea cypriaca TaxID=1187855 RepID=A0A931A6L3_9ACTN|nr:sugar kinase [Nonomuraea cypriaca]MBF8184334.1 sugar kinase [Nonomuraea cypriaca]
MPHPQILALGEPLLEFNAAAEGSLDDAAAFHLGFGGDTSNMVIAAGRSGAAAGYLTRVGDDAFGHALLRLWKSEGVDVRHVTCEPGGATGIYFVTRHGEGRHAFTYRRAGSPASRLSPADVPGQAVAEARILHLSGITQAISASACDAAFHAIDVAGRSGTLVSYDPNYRPALWPLERARAVVLRTAELADVVLPNLEEGRLLTGLEEPREVLAAFARRGPSIVALKMGADGVLLGTGDRVTHVPAHPVTAVDATGAGDTFDGAFAARLLDGDSPVEATGYAVVAAALTTTGPGAVGPIPHRDTVLAERSPT